MLRMGVFIRGGGTSLCSVISSKPKNNLMRRSRNHVSEASHVEFQLILRTDYQIT